MRLAFVSVFPPNTNGIGSYTHDLCRALQARSRDTSVVVLADRAGEDTHVDVEVDRCWSMNGNWVPDLLDAVDRARPDVVHLQHGGYMGRDARVPSLLDGLRRRNIHTVITLHGVYPQQRRSLWRPGKWSPSRFHRALHEISDRIVIHQRAGALAPLIAHGVAAEHVTIIPHGTPEVPAIERHAARAALGLPEDRPLALFLGFIEFSKGVDTVVRAFREVAAEVPGAQLVIAGRVEQHDLQDRLYRYLLEWRMRRGRREGWIDYRPGYLPSGDIPAYLAAADVVVFPYRQNHGSASGVLHRTFAAGRAMVCSLGPKFVDAADLLGDDAGVALPAPTDVSAWSRSLARVLQDDALRARLARTSSELGRRSAWPAVADQHLSLYRDVTSARPA
jgi:glycosyltransferase involved in cell wall biosynthesis